MYPSSPHPLHSLVRAPAEEESHQLQRQQSDRLRLGREQLQHRLDAQLEVEGGHHGGWVVGHQPDQRVQHVLQVLILPKRRRRASDSRR